MKYKPETGIVDVDEDKLLLKKESRHYIESAEEARSFVERELQKSGKREEDLIQDKGIRRELVAKLRRNSCLALKEIGELAGGISQSMVCKILKGI